MQNVIERVLNVLIFLLESPRPVTAEDIRQTVPGYSADSDEAFHRMFERDKSVLRDLGVPLELVALDAWEVDFGDLGVGDRWADLAIASLSLDWNFGEGHQAEFFDAYGVEPDAERIDYYRRLWDLES